MRTSAQNRSPIVEFLGEDAGAGGPFALLGLGYEIGSDEQIIRARNRRLNQIDLHRHRSTPDAGEVRLAVHAAASQLLDPNLRVQLAKRWPEGVPISVPKAWKTAPATPKLSAWCIENAKQLIAASGGWNATARNRLAHFARVNRVAALELIEALNPPGRAIEPAVDLIAKPAVGSGDGGRVLLIEPPPRGAGRWFAVYGLVLVMGGLVLGTIVMSPPRFLVGGRDVSTPTVGNDDRSHLPAERPGVDGAESGSVAQRDDLTHYTAIAHEIDHLVERAEPEPDESVARFTTIYPLFVGSWTAFPEPALERTGLQIGEFVSRISKSQGAFERLLPLFTCSDPSEEPAARIVRTAVVDVVLSDPSLDSRARSMLTSIRKQCSGYDPRPTQSITESLVAVAGLFGVDSRSDDPVWWKSWLQAVEASTREDEAQRTRLVLSAMSARLHDQTAAGKAWSQTVVELVNAVSWRAGAPERYWLLSQFADETVSTPRLAALTLALATESGAEHVTVQMVLNPSSTFLQQQALAKVYRDAWADPSAPAEASNGYPELVNELHIRVSITPIKMDEQQGIEAIIELARLNTAAWRFFGGDDAGAAEALKGAGSAIAPSSQPAGTLTLDSNSRDTAWAEDAINAQSAKKLSVLFAQLVGDDGPGVNSAHALVYLATLNPNSELRSLATSQILRYQDRPSVLLALDRAIGEKRISSRLEQLVRAVVDGPLPARTNPEWFGIVHREILGLTAEALATATGARFSDLETELGSVYGGRFVGTEHHVEAPGQSPVLLARTLTEQMLLDARTRIGSTQGDRQAIRLIESALAVRVAQASSEMHRFLGYQQAICQLLGLFIQEEIPGSGFRVRGVLDELRTRLGQSGTITDQLAQGERCIAQLWVIRLEGARP